MIKKLKKFFGIKTKHTRNHTEVCSLKQIESILNEVTIVKNGKITNISISHIGTGMFGLVATYEYYE